MAAITHQQTIPLLIRSSRQRSEPRGRFRLGHHQRLRGGVQPIVGSFAHNTSEALRRRLIEAKRSLPLAGVYLEELVGAMVELAELWSGGVFPPGAVLTVPPQGASLPATYLAEAIGRAVSTRLGLPYLTLLRRVDVKRYHSPWDSRRQLPYVAEIPEARPGFIVVLDDLLTTGTTMRLSIEALRGAGVACAGLIYSGR